MNTPHVLSDFVHANKLSAEEKSQSHKDLFSSNFHTKNLFYLK